VQQTVVAPVGTTVPVAETGFGVHPEALGEDGPARTTDVLPGALTQLPSPKMVPAGLLGHSPSA
jgi:hypothetical protein